MRYDEAIDVIIRHMNKELRKRGKVAGITPEQIKASVDYNLNMWHIKPLTAREHNKFKNHDAFKRHLRHYHRGIINIREFAYLTRRDCK